MFLCFIIVVCFIICVCFGFALFVCCVCVAWLHVNGGVAMFFRFKFEEIVGWFSFSLCVVCCVRVCLWERVAVGVFLCACV